MSSSSQLSLVDQVVAALRPAFNFFGLGRSPSVVKRCAGSPLAIALLIMVGMGLTSPSARASTLYWDADYLSGNGPTGGSGNWTMSLFNTNNQSISYAADWSSSSGNSSTPDQRWYQPGTSLYSMDPTINTQPDAVFGWANGVMYGSEYPNTLQSSSNGAYFVNVTNSSVAVNSLNFNSSGYDLTGNPITLSGAGLITFNNSGTTIINNAIDGTAGRPSPAMPGAPSGSTTTAAFTPAQPRSRAARWSGPEATATLTM